ncbi:AraC family transcriptional regulator ligand-binding domain-containing protein [Sphingobium cloacae]|uniref:AraC type helix-turn-helix n=1 Tax=Sphingobium cloacae TaxID=120107 RepID=A0A1E1F1Y2_9SPHN|nr:AraC family transcriptional regulator ligand-binding domain-containing protein [Sphingobium cloacae]BAV64472.1 AraC type helix-turn-helix [Sphingobium cloacae]
MFGHEKLVRSYGGDPFDLAARVGLPRKAFTHSDMLISWSRQGVFCELVAEELDRPNFGLEHTMSLPDTFPNSGAAIFLSQITGTFEEWIHACERFTRFHTNAWTLHLIKDDSPFARLRVLEDPLARAPRQQAEGLVSSLYRMARTVINATTETNHLVRFRHPKPSDTRLHEELFGCPIEFDAPYNETVFRREYLERPTGGRLVTLRLVFDAYLRYRIASATSHSAWSCPICAASTTRSMPMCWNIARFYSTARRTPAPFSSRR